MDFSTLPVVVSVKQLKVGVGYTLVKIWKDISFAIQNAN